MNALEKIYKIGYRIEEEVCAVNVYSVEPSDEETDDIELLLQESSGTLLSVNADDAFPTYSVYDGDDLIGDGLTQDDLIEWIEDVLSGGKPKDI